MARPPRVEDSTMLGRVSSQRMDVSFNALSATLMHQDHFSRVYHGGSPGAPPRVDQVRNVSSETAVGIVDGQPYGEHFLPSSDRDFSSGNSGMLGSVDRNEGSVDEGQRFVNGSSHVSIVVNTSPRVPDWAGSEQPGEMGSEVDYRDMEDRDGGSSGGSQSDGPEEDEEEDVDMDGEGEDIKLHQGVTRLVDHGLPGQKGYETLSNIQIDGMERGRHELVAGVQSSEGFQKTKFDREISSKASTSSAPSLGMFLSPSSTSPFLNSFSTPPSVGSILGHADGNPAAPNGTIVVASGLGTSPGYYRDGMTKETSMRDTYVKESQNLNHDKGRIAHSSPVPEAVPIGTATEEHYSSFVQATAAIPQDPGNQIVAFSHRKSHETMEMPLRSALTDPLTGALMDDATILLCGHSFGNESLQRVLENNACISCGAAAKREDMAPNHALRSVVHVYKREEERWKELASKSAKRRRERLEQDRQNSGELTPFEFSRHKGVQFPYKVNDRVLIKGNKRTPERFVGRNAVITTQCLNGWYVVRTSDNGESVKLQYRSLTKTKTDEQPSSKELQPKITGPNWL